jgi:hypothetical protein
MIRPTYFSKFRTFYWLLYFSKYIFFLDMAYAGWGTKLRLGELTDQVELSEDGHIRE